MLLSVLYFESFDLLHETKGSLKNFEELLTMARHMYCKGAGLGEDDETLKKKWPSDWTAARQILIAEGYEDAKEYFICLNDVHPQHWDIAESQSDLCRHCGEKVVIPYYYLGLKGKIKHWVSHPDVCHKLLAHWREKEHWLNRNEGWHTQKELWVESSLQNYHGSGIPILSGACRCDASIQDVQI